MNQLSIRLCDYCGEKEAKHTIGAINNACDDCFAPQEAHTCPYAVEINDDSEFTCTCSKAQEHECAMDI